jgi:hypothetical protein
MRSAIASRGLITVRSSNDNSDPVFGFLSIPLKFEIRAPFPEVVKLVDVDIPDFCESEYILSAGEGRKNLRTDFCFCAGFIHSETGSEVEATIPCTPKMRGGFI